MGVGGQTDVVDNYECHLPESVKRIAKEELREDDSIREQSLEQMREWIAKHPNIKRCRTGTKQWPFFSRGFSFCTSSAAYFL